ncbi:MAG: peptidase M4 family protein [Tatlockia sp.]|nr:peptidase M4 family protein [Tatlockia sp.]
MQPRFYLITATLTILLSSSLQSAQPLPLQTESFDTLQQQFQLSIPGLVKNPQILPDILQFIQQRRDANQVSHIRMQQQYRGFVVFGGYAIMHSKNKASQLLMAQDVQMNGILYRGLQTELAKPTADFVKNSTLAMQQFKEQYKGEALSEETINPIVYVDPKHQAHWAYFISVLVQYQDKIPARLTAIIDAKTYKPFKIWDDIKTALEPVKGQGYGGNCKTGSYVFGKDLPLLDLSRDNVSKKCFMENPAVKIVDMDNQKISANNAMEFDCMVNVGTDKTRFMTGYNGDGYDKVNGAFSPSNDAMYAGYVIKQMYRDWCDIEALTHRGQPMQLIMRVHYGNNYENAYWDGKQMTYGDGANRTFPLVSLGIAAHELSHGFTEQHSNLVYTEHSGAINESFSDMAVKAAEFYSTGKTIWMIGAEILKEGSGREALRYMDIPSRDGHSIDSAIQYSEDLKVHYSSGVFNRLFFLMATTRGWNVRKAFQVMVKANMDYWIPTTTYDEAGCGVINAALDLGYSIIDVQTALSKVAVNYDVCVPAQL